MSALLDPKLLRYYQQELAYVREAGQQFARAYPKIARRLDFSGFESSDPHTERLIESFAFLAARLHKDLDDKFPRISQNLLSVLYPQLVAPVPSVAIAQFEASTANSPLTTAYRIPRGTELRSRETFDDAACTFQTCFDVDVWPLALTSVDVVPLASCPLPKHVVLPSFQALRLRFHAPHTPFHQLSPVFLRLHVTGQPEVASALYDALMLDFCPVFQRSFPRDSAEEAIFEPSGGGVTPTGFADDQAMLPYPLTAHPAYRLLQEYAVLPQKFMFVDVGPLSCREATQDLEILLPLSPKVTDLVPATVSRDNIALGCTPIVNVFRRISEPIRLDYTRDDYRLVGDVRREASTEIHSIQRVTSTLDDTGGSRDYWPYFSYDHGAQSRQETRFWSSHRRPSIFTEWQGTDVFLSFVDLDFQPLKAAQETVFAHVLCTNRGLAERLSPNAELIMEAAAPVESVRCLDRPTRQVPATLDVPAQWKLVSHLCLNHLSLLDPDMGLEALKEQMRLYNLDGLPGLEEALSHLVDLRCTPVVRRMGDDAWRGFVRGLGVTMTVAAGARSPLCLSVFGQILAHYLSLFVSINAFVELTFQKSEGEGPWKRWNPILGEQFLL